MLLCRVQFKLGAHTAATCKSTTCATCSRTAIHGAVDGGGGGGPQHRWHRGRSVGRSLSITFRGRNAFWNARKTHSLRRHSVTHKIRSYTLTHRHAHSHAHKHARTSMQARTIIPFQLEACVVVVCWGTEGAPKTAHEQLHNAANRRGCPRRVDGPRSMSLTLASVCVFIGDRQTDLKQKTRWFRFVCGGKWPRGGDGERGVDSATVGGRRRAESVPCVRNGNSCTNDRLHRRPSADMRSWCWWWW